MRRRVVGIGWWRAAALALAPLLIAGCASAAAQTQQRQYLPLAPRGDAPGPTATAPPGRACQADRLSVRALSDAAASAVSFEPVPRSLRELQETARPDAVEADTPRLPRVERS